MTDPIRQAVDRLGDIPADIVPVQHRRPTKATVARLLAHHGQPVNTLHTEVVEDVDGIPAHIRQTEHPAVLDVDLANLGWTEAEYNNPDITE